MEYVCPDFIPGIDKPCQHYIQPDNKREPGFCIQPTMFRCIEAMKVKLPAISFSSLADFIHCKLRYKHRIVDGLQVKPEHLPDSVKLGRGWDAYLRYLIEGADYQPAIASLQLNDIQQAKLNALARACEDLQIEYKNVGLLGYQYQINVPVGSNQIVGYVDRAYENHFIETKLSTRPDFYRQRENLTYQLGTHFMAYEAWGYADLEITRVPSLKLKSDESAEAYEGRCYGDIISRPAFYFIGWDRNSGTYGVRFWRSEFDLDEVFQTFVYVLEEIKNTVRRGSWYPNNLACHVPSPCPFLYIKKSGVISPEIYSRKEVRN